MDGQMDGYMDMCDYVDGWMEIDGQIDVPYHILLSFPGR